MGSGTDLILLGRCRRLALLPLATSKQQPAGQQGEATAAAKTASTTTTTPPAPVVGANLSGVVWENTRCPDGTDTNQDDGTGVNNLGS